MGLREKRIIHQLQTQTLPAYEAALNHKTGGAQIKWQVDWESFSTCDEESLERVEGFGLKKIIEAFEAVCIDDLGKQAVKNGLKAIAIKQVNEASLVKALMDNKTLKVCLDFSDFYNGYISEFTLQEVLENGL